MKLTIFVFGFIVCTTVATPVGQDSKQKIQVAKWFNGRSTEHSLVHPPPPEDERRVKSLKSVSMAFFNQKLDHINAQENRMWQQQYLTNNAYYKAGGPIFVMIGGEGPISTGWMDYGWWKECAKTYGAMMYQLEHRYYGKSKPTPDATTANLRWLNSEQALADLANFILTIKQQTGVPNAKVVVFGGSYPGNLAAWFRLKYPHVAVGAIASSAPVYAEADFYQYMETVSYALDYVTPGCNEVVAQTFQTIATMYDGGQLSQLNSVFNPCTPLNPSDPMNKAALFARLAGVFQSQVQYNNQGRYSVAAVCAVMMNTNGGTQLQRLASLYSADEFKCLQYDYNDDVAYLSETGWNEDANRGGSREWIYQTCSEFGYYQTTNSHNQPFGFQSVPIGFLEEIYCNRVFGINSTMIASTIKQNNQIFGGRGLVVNNVVLPNGSVDPWHSLSVLSSSNPAETAEYVIGRIPKELEGVLVALIPFSDKRLKPRRRWLWFMGGFLLMVVVCALLLFFLLPRSLTLTPPLQKQIYRVTVNTSDPGHRTLRFNANLRVSNANFFPVKAISATATINNEFYFLDPSQIGFGSLTEPVSVPVQASNYSLPLTFFVKLTSELNSICDNLLHALTMQFQISVSFTYLLHTEQDFIKTYIMVCCDKSGNCTKWKP